MQESINDFLNYLTLEKKYSDYTEVNYEIDLDKYLKFLQANQKKYLHVKVQDISAYIVYLKKSGFKSTSINRNLSTLRSFYNYLIFKKQVDLNPVDLVRGLKTEKKLPNYFKYEEFLAMLEVTKEKTSLNIRNQMILELLLATGLRVSELASIKLSELDINERQLKVLGKGQKERIVFFGNHAKTAINAYLADARSLLLKNKTSEYLILNHLGNKITDRGIRLVIEDIIKKTAIVSKVSPHTFRHTFATMMLNSGANIKSVQELLGHASLNTTSIYTHLTNEEIRRSYLNAHPRAKK